ncbi:trehalose-phosphatase [[Mycobacterium] wendilense]|uniref:Trehalose 6-phosphate phosphatase n=1 Tax=[Mycobacterium] wendilense TaxID=3064284 RepID=A0ABM9M8W7_9MYCO|nr:trehalose-phosphatase [Mycolicibacterium sp. MU0050]CAJ1579225.1 trehalose-phosphatase [Mycolicibacterium sp. MU0050]
MSQLPDDVSRALRAAARTPHLLVACDFDGTMAPIVNHPPDARPLPTAAAALQELATLPDTTAALISGRALADLARLSGMPPTVHLVGSHGAEFSTGFTRDIDEQELGRIKSELTEIASRYPGVTVEPKLASVALHVRNASAEDGAAALAAAEAAAQSWAAEATAGKAVLEFAVITTDKGEAIDILRERTGSSTAIYFGDDVTDEKAFRRMRDTDVAVKVGPGDTLAGFRVAEPTDVAAALELLLDARRKRG